MTLLGDVSGGFPVWSVVSSREEFGRPDLPVLTVISERGVEVRDMEGGGRAVSEDLTRYRVVRPGDLVVNRLWARFGAYGVSRHQGIISPAYWVLKLDHNALFPRYAHYLLRSGRYLAEIGRISKNLPPNGFDLPWNQFRSIRLPSESIATQRAIADFLDAETARIDALIAKKRRMLAVLEELRWLAFEIALSAAGVTLPDSVDPERLRNVHLPPDWMAPKLSSVLLQLTNGYVGPTRDILRDAGIRYIQGLHIKRGLIDFERRPFYVEEEWHDAHPRTTLRPGDVLIVQTGDIGQVAVVPDGFGPANCHALLIARANPDLVNAIYLGMYLQSRFGYNSLVRVATGALHPHLEFGIRNVPVVVPPRSVQEEVVAEVFQRQGATDRVVAGLTRQIDLLAERRQALITATVTGELDVAESNVEEAS